MDAVRYYIALIILVGVPAGLSMWFVVHPLVRFWRRRGPVLTYLVVVMVAALIGGTLFRLRGPLLRVEFGFSWPLGVAGVLVAGAAAVLERFYRRQLTVSTLVGLPEVSAKRPRKLLTGGIYGRIRHPRYVGLWLEVLGFSLIANYAASYLVLVGMVPVLYVTVVLEERELSRHFGEPYRRYCAEVPRFLPGIRRRGRHQPDP